MVVVADYVLFLGAGLDYLVDFLGGFGEAALAGEEDLEFAGGAGSHEKLGEDAAEGPEVDGGGVGLHQDDLGGSVPTGHDVEGDALVRHALVALAGGVVGLGHRLFVVVLGRLLLEF